MKVVGAVAQRIVDLCAERGIAYNYLANQAGIPPMTLYSILDGKSKNPGITNIKAICDALELPLKVFFDSPLFDQLEQEIQ